jgi:hypothetical protein
VADIETRTLALTERRRIRDSQPQHTGARFLYACSVDGVRGESQRWQGPKSSFPWEQEALDYLRGLMPDAEPYRAWQTFTFTAASGHVREVPGAGRLRREAARPAADEQQERLGPNCRPRIAWPCPR